MLQRDLTDEEYIRELLASAGVTPNRSSGQNFLISSEVRDAILTITEAGPSQVTELGAGMGPLTQGLLQQKMHVRAIERDETLAAILEKQIPAKLRSQLTLLKKDLQETDWTWPDSYQIAGNIPYNISGLILRRLTQLEPTPTQVVLLVQKEVGERIVAQPPNMHLLSVAVQLWGTPQLLLQVPANCFWPQPKVASQLLLLTPHERPLPLIEREHILKVAKQFFQQRRKQLGGVLVSLYNLPRETVATKLKTLTIDPTQRPQELTLEQWQGLTDVFSAREE